MQSHSPYSNYICHTPDIAAIGTFLTYLCRGILTYYISNNERMGYMLRHNRIRGIDCIPLKTILTIVNQTARNVRKIYELIYYYSYGPTLKRFTFKLAI